MKVYIFLKIKDPDLNSLIKYFNKVFYNKPLNDYVHLTVRGPYHEKQPKDKVKEWNNIIKNDVLRIDSVSTFSNNKQNVVYFKVDSPNLRKIWDKPDYRINKFGYNPHISIYVGPNKRFANRLYNYLKECDLVFYTEMFILKQYVKGESTINNDIDNEIPEYPLRLKYQGLIKDQFYKDIEKMSKQYFGKL